VNNRFLKWLLTVTVFFSMIFVAANVAAKKPVKPPPDPVAEPNHALAINGYEKSLDIYAVDVDGGNPVRIVRRASGFPTSAGATVWSPDGTRIVWSDISYKNLQMVNVDGSNRQEILAPTEEMWPYIGGQRNLAPSGFDCDIDGDGFGESANLLYFLGLMITNPLNPLEDANEEFFVLDLDDLSVPPIRLTHDTDGELVRHSTLDVSPDGQFIATWTYTSGENWDAADAQLELRDACQAGLPVIASWTAADLGQVPGYQFFARIDWSSANVLAVSGHNHEVDDEIYLIDFDGSVTAEKLIGTGMVFGEGVNNRRATWSPDGTQLAFTSDHDVYVYDFGENTFTQIASFKLNRDIDWRPTWVKKP
jgi:WD40 repeat protein